MSASTFPTLASFLIFFFVFGGWLFFSEHSMGDDDVDNDEVVRHTTSTTKPVAVKSTRAARVPGWLMEFPMGECRLWFCFSPMNVLPSFFFPHAQTPLHLTFALFLIWLWCELKKKVFSMTMDMTSLATRVGFFFSKRFDPRKLFSSQCGWKFWKKKFK